MFRTHISMCETTLLGSEPTDAHLEQCIIVSKFTRLHTQMQSYKNHTSVEPPTFERVNHAGNVKFAATDADHAKIVNVLTPSRLVNMSKVLGDRHM